MLRTLGDLAVVMHASGNVKPAKTEAVERIDAISLLDNSTARAVAPTATAWIRHRSPALTAI